MILLINGTDQGSLQPYQKKKREKKGGVKNKKEKRGYREIRTKSVFVVYWK